VPRLPDGTVLPSFLDVEDRARETPGTLMTMTDGLLRVGEVLSAHYPDDPENVSKVEVEYIVRVNLRDGAGTTIQTPYRCVLADGFGAAGDEGDHLRHSLRAQDAPKEVEAVGNGAIVLIACINGDLAQAVIISCLRNPKRGPKDLVGRFLDFAFNGVKVSIGDDGSFTLQVPGATKTDGSPDNRDENNHGSKVTLASNGDVTVSDENGDSIVVSPGEKRIEVKAGDHETTVENDWELRASKVRVIADEVELGDSNLNIVQHGVVLGGGVDTFSGQTYSTLGNSSKTVKANK
jgi:hypothetical protein